jgi:Uncharacterized protein conserved in bacteria
LLTARKDTPPEIVKQLHEAFKQVITTPEWQNYLATNGEMNTYMSLEEFDKHLAWEADMAASYLKEIGQAK